MLNKCEDSATKMHSILQKHTGIVFCDVCVCVCVCVCGFFFFFFLNFNRYNACAA